MTRAACVAVGLLVLAGSVGCATRAFLRPSGPATPFPDAMAIWGDATRACRSVSSYRAQLRVSGRLRGGRIPGVTAGLALDRDRIAMSLNAGGAPEINMAGTAAHLTLLMHRAGRFAEGPAESVVDALIGVRLTPAVLLAVLSGCVVPGGDVAGAERIGDVARLTSPAGTIYLRQRSNAWQLAAADVGEMRIDYRRLESGWPRELTIRQGADVTLALQVVELDIDPALPPGLFQLRVPESMSGMSLEDLRVDGPFSARR